MQWTVLVLWLLGDGALPTQTGLLLEARQKFATLAECTKALPDFQKAVVRDFGEPGVVVCVAAAEPRVAAIPAATP